MKINLIPNNYKVVDFYEEIWRDIKGYEGLYQVSNIGRVRSLDREVRNGNGWYTKKGQILTPCKNKYGYLYVCLSKNGKIKIHKIHRLTAFAFVEGYFEGAHIDHINTVRDDNRVVNLRWVTHKENMDNPLTREARKGENAPMYGKHHTEESRKKMSELHKGKGCKKVICIETEQVFDSIKEAGEYVGVSGNAISNCLRGKRKTTAGFHWAYYEEEVEANVS